MDRSNGKAYANILLWTKKLMELLIKRWKSTVDDWFIVAGNWIRDNLKPYRGTRNNKKILIEESYGSR